MFVLEHFTGRGGIPLGQIGAVTTFLHRGEGEEEGSLESLGGGDQEPEQGQDRGNAQCRDAGQAGTDRAAAGKGAAPPHQNTARQIAPGAGARARHKSKPAELAAGQRREQAAGQHAAEQTEQRALAATRRPVQEHAL